MKNDIDVEDAVSDGWLLVCKLAIAESNFDEEATSVLKVFGTVEDNKGVSDVQDGTPITELEVATDDSA